MNNPGALPAVIVFGGFENALSIVRSLGRKSISVYALAEQHSEVLASRYARPIELRPSKPYLGAALDYLLSDSSKGLEGSVLLVAGDEELLAVADHYDELSAKFRLDRCNPAAQRTMLNKLATYEVARVAGVPTPRFWKVRSRADVDLARDEFVFPLLVKPEASHEFQKHFAGKFFRADNCDELLDGYERLERAGIAAVLVELIPGPDSDLCSYYTYLDESGNARFDFTKRVIRRYPKNMGLGSYHITDQVEGIRELSLTLFRQVGLQGLANAEFKLDRRDGQMKLIECNARFTAANALVARAGFDLAEFVYHEIVGLPRVELKNFRTGLRQWDPVRDFLAYRELNQLGELTLAEWISSVCHVPAGAYFSWRDPKPSMVRMAKRFRKARRKPRSNPTATAAQSATLINS